MARSTNQAGVELIKSFEGYRSEAYRCPANVWTIGYGTTKGIKPGMTVNQATAEKYLKDDMRYFEQKVAELVNVKVSDNQFAALVSFTYNLGEGALGQSTLLRVLNRGDYSAAAEQFLRWNMAGGRVLEGLNRRRRAEVALFNKPDPKIAPAPVATTPNATTPEKT
jgi:GH24 family phage-related lysozyme (muramidase)